MSTTMTTIEECDEKKNDEQRCKILTKFIFVIVLIQEKSKKND